MLTKCDFKVEPNACLISSPENRDILPGRMLRLIVANLEKRYQLYEYSSVIGYKAVDEMEDVVGVVELQCSFLKRLLGKQEICVFQKLHPSFYEEDYVKLSDEEKELFQKNMQEGDDFVETDYTVSIPSFYFMVVTQDDCRKLMDVLNHLKMRDFAEVRDAVATLCEATVSIFDEFELLAEYIDESLPSIMIEGLDDWVKPPEQVEYLEI